MSIESEHRRFSVTFGRLRFTAHIYTHHYPTSPDRWVVQLHFVYDKKKR